MMHAASRAPDHGNLTPYRFIIAQGEQLTKLGGLFVEAIEATGLEMSEAQKLKLQNKPNRAPMVIISLACIDNNHNKIPGSEQFITSGLAVHQLTLAAKELGFDCMWRTGGITYNSHLHKLLKLDNSEQITGFIYVGSAKKQKPEPAAKEISQLYSNLDELV